MAAPARDDGSRRPARRAPSASSLRRRCSGPAPAVRPTRTEGDRARPHLPHVRPGAAQAPARRRSRREARARARDRPVLGRLRLDAGARPLRPWDRRRPRAAQDLLRDRGPLGRAGGHRADPRTLRGVGGPRLRLPDGRRGARHGAAEAEPARGQARAHQSAVRRLNSRAWLWTPGASRSSAAGRSASRCSRACSARDGGSRRRSSSRAAARSGSTSSPSATASRRRSRTRMRSAARPSS